MFSFRYQSECPNFRISREIEFQLFWKEESGFGRIDFGAIPYLKLIATLLMKSTDFCVLLCKFYPNKHNYHVPNLYLPLPQNKGPSNCAPTSLFKTFLADRAEAQPLVWTLQDNMTTAELGRWKSTKEIQDIKHVDNLIPKNPFAHLKGFDNHEFTFECQWCYFGAMTYPKDENGNLVNSGRDKPEMFNAFFASIFNMDNGPRGSQCPELEDHDCEKHQLPADPELVWDLLLQLDPYKSTGPDGIYPRILKELLMSL
ncbi:hypothetical protein WISP_30412 [Willisornis vidua]|uniref:Uncharacterized protein n=1 Tax=Willisornis vidua TaxID=1566151 RepID=A0ABQ9DKD2_9PASS|nr:hypothetical protein WISP_30412 [Willisornis vidua]